MPRHAGAVPLQIIGPLREIVGEIPDQSVHDKGPWRTLPPHYDLTLVAASVLIASFASYVALEFGEARARLRTAVSR